MSSRDYRRPALHSFQPYKAGKPVAELRRELGIPGPIAKLSSNENPLGPSPKAVEAIRGVLDKLHLYPFDDAYYFKQAVARHHGLDPSQVFPAAGSVEVLELCGTCFMEPGDEVLTSARSFAIYYLATMKAAARLVVTPCKDEYHYDLDAMLQRVSERTKIVFLANPTNPTGTWFAAQAFDRFMERLPDNILVVYDEAYHHYVTEPDLPRAQEWIERGRDIILLRTFSKAHGLAGLRVGYAVGPAPIITGLNQGRTNFNINIPAQVAAIAALEDDEFVARSRAFNHQELDYLRRELEVLPVTIPPSQANFLLLDTARPAGELFDELQRKGLIVRPMAAAGMPGAIRVNVGTHEQNMRLVAALKELLG